MPPTVELTLQRRATKQFIDARPQTIILKSRGQAIFDAGTKKFGNPVDRLPQVLRVVWMTESGIHERPPEGTRRFDFALVGEHDAEMAIGDYWKDGDQEYRLEAISPSNGWEVKAYGISHGPKPN